MTEDFGQLTSSILRPMVIVTTTVDNERSGCLVGFHTQCSIAPPRYAVWLSKANHTYRVGVFAASFGVHFLTKGNVVLAELFRAQTGDQVDKFATCEWTTGPGGVPLLAEVGNRLVGRKVSMTDDGSDHVCVVLDPLVVDRDGTQHEWLLMSDIDTIEPGHPARDRQRP